MLIKDLHILWLLIENNKNYIDAIVYNESIHKSKFRIKFQVLRSIIILFNAVHTISVIMYLRSTSLIFKKFPKTIFQNDKHYF